MKNAWLNFSTTCNFELMQKKVFKHIPLQYADGFLDGTSVRIGTLYDFRNFEEHSPGVFDPQEGIATTEFLETESLRTEERLDINEVVNPLMGLPINTRVDFNHINLVLAYSDCYIFSTSLSDEPEIVSSVINTDLKELSVIIEIQDIFDYAQHIARRLFKLGLSTGQYWCEPVVYKSLSREYTLHGIQKPDPFVKDIRFAKQEEWRVMFEPTRTKIIPEIIQLNDFPKKILCKVK